MRKPYRVAPEVEEDLDGIWWYVYEASNRRAKTKGNNLVAWLARLRSDLFRQIRQPGKPNL